jgi:glycosyltransferase involved in cell wall biosynthesis
MVRNGADVELRILGGGDPQTLRAQAARLQISDRVSFDGTLPAGAPVRRWLDQLDIYAQPSLTEGLPRGLIEAMSRGLPAAASNVGGIPELLEDRFLFRPDDVGTLSDILMAFFASPSLRYDAGQLNCRVAAQYCSDILNEKRDRFLSDIRFGLASKSTLFSSSR